MSDFQPGDIVDITIKGVRIERVTPMNHGPSILQIAHPSAPGNGFDLSPDAPGITVERTAPENWPPQLGDTWADRDGDVWFAVVGKTGHAPTLIAKTGARISPEGLRKRYGPPFLLNRDGGAS